MIYLKTSGGEGRGGEIKEDKIYQKFGHFKNLDKYFLGQTDKQTNRHTDRQTLWIIGKLHFQKLKLYYLNETKNYIKDEYNQFGGGGVSPGPQ